VNPLATREFAAECPLSHYFATSAPTSSDTMALPKMTETPGPQPGRRAAAMAAKGALLCASIGLAGAGVPDPWLSVAHLNCYTDKTAGFMGGEVLSAATNPIVPFLTTPQCAHQCVMEAGCGAFVMQETDEIRPSCWLRHSIELDKCDKSFTDFIVYMDPKKYPATQETWLVYPGIECLAAGSLNGATEILGASVPKGASLKVCQDQCKTKVDCEGIMWLQGLDSATRALTKTCWLLKQINVQGCLRTVDTTKYQVFVRDTSAVAAPMDGPTSQTAQHGINGAPWASRSGTLCKAGSGAVSLGHLVSGHKSLEQCQQECSANTECQAILMHDTADTSSNCYLLKDIVWDKCEKSVKYFNMWVKPVPSPTLEAGAQWFSYTGTTCDPMAGADFVVPYQNTVPGHLDLRACEAKCKETQGCQAIVWHDTNDDTLQNCGLRKNVRLNECKAAAGVNFRIQARFLPKDTSRHPLGKKPWGAVAGKACAEAGSQAITTTGFNPAQGHKSLEECQNMCVGHGECKAIVMVDTKNGNGDNCWLRKEVNTAACPKAPDTNVWFKPGERAEDEDKWLSYSATNCYTNRGAERAVPTQDVLPGHLPMEDCQRRCLEIAGCEAIVWHDTKNSMESNCYLRRNVRLSECVVHADFNLRILNKKASAHPLGKKPWGAVAGKDCVTGGSSQAINANGYNPVPTHKLLERCQEQCLAQAECTAIVMKSTVDATAPNCWLRKDVNIAKCSEDTAQNVWFKPGVRADDDDKWLSYSGTNCYPGSGAERAVPGQDALPEGQVTLVVCQKRCLETAGCEAIVWRETQGANCHLRKNVDVAQCEVDPAFNLRILNKKASAHPEGKKPWPTVAGQSCTSPGSSGLLPSFAPVPNKHVLLSECQKLCQAHPECKAVNLVDTKDNTIDNCWLLKDSDVSQCATDGNTNIWFEPGVRGAHDDRWLSYSGTNCRIGHGADNALLMQASLSGHMTMLECEKQCLSTGGCEAIVWHDTGDSSTSNCELRKNVDLAKCDVDPEYNLRILNKEYIPKPWPTVAATSCSQGHGATPVSQDGFSPMPEHMTLEACQFHCEHMTECQGIVMSDTHDDVGKNCYLYNQISVSNCEHDAYTNLWFKPGIREETEDQWVSYAATSCYPGMGADRAIPTEDALQGHILLAECESRCLALDDCQAIVWRDTGDGTSSNCYLRKNVQVDKCEKNTQYNLRILNKAHMSLLSNTPWPSVASRFCGAKAKLAQTYEELADNGPECSAGLAVADKGECEAALASLGKKPQNAMIFVVNDATMPYRCSYKTDQGAPNMYWNDDLNGKPKINMKPVCRKAPAVQDIEATGFDPVNRHVTLMQCQKLCNSRADCGGLMMLETADATSPNCWLYASISVKDCVSSTVASVWLKPSATVKASDYMWESFPGRNCFPPTTGADYAVAGQDAVTGHKTLEECEALCMDTTGCEAIVWKDTSSHAEDNCHLRKDVKLDACKNDPAYNVRKKNPLGKALVKNYQNWKSIAGLDCQPGKGADNVAAAGMDPMGVHLSLAACQAQCMMQPDCQAIAMDPDVTGNNCFLRKNIVIGDCPASTVATMWFMPGHEPVDARIWETVAGANCFRGAGGDIAKPNTDVLPGHLTMKQCEEACSALAACSAIVFKHGEATASNCYLRKDIEVNACLSTNDFELRYKPVGVLARYAVPASTEQRLRSIPSGTSKELPGSVAMFAVGGGAILGLAALVVVGRRGAQRGLVIEEGSDTAALVNAVQ